MGVWQVSLVGGTAVLGTGEVVGGTIVAVDAASGARRWRWHRTGWQLLSIAASARGATVVGLWLTHPEARTSRLTVTVFDLRTGQLRWERSDVGTGVSYYGGGIVLGGSVIFALADDTLRAFAARDGHRLWARSAPPGCAWGLASARPISTAGAPIFPYACLRAHHMFGGGLVRVQPNSGATAWRLYRRALPIGLQQAGGTVLLSATPERNGSTLSPVIEVFDAATGRSRWHGAGLVDIGHVGVGLTAVDPSGDVYGWRLGSGSLVRRAGVNGRVRWSFKLPVHEDPQSIALVGSVVTVAGVDDRPPNTPPQLLLFDQGSGRPIGRLELPSAVPGGFGEDFFYNLAAIEPALTVMTQDATANELGAFSMPRLTGTR